MKTSNFSKYFYIINPIRLYWSKRIPGIVWRNKRPSHRSKVDDGPILRRCRWWNRNKCLQTLPVFIHPPHPQCNMVSMTMLMLKTCFKSFNDEHIDFCKRTKISIKFETNLFFICCLSVVVSISIISSWNNIKIAKQDQFLPTCVCSCTVHIHSMRAIK